MSGGAGNGASCGLSPNGSLAGGKNPKGSSPSGISVTPSGGLGSRGRKSGTSSGAEPSPGAGQADGGGGSEGHHGHGISPNGRRSSAPIERRRTLEAGPRRSSGVNRRALTRVQTISGSGATRGGNNVTTARAPAREFGKWAREFGLEPSLENSGGTIIGVQSIEMKAIDVGPMRTKTVRSLSESSLAGRDNSTASEDDC